MSGEQLVGVHYTLATLQTCPGNGMWGYKMIGERLVGVCYTLATLQTEPRNGM
jgi:hypothetical protein